ncbi:GntR family transcriptional regulator [Rathayibacter soli]|uniref:GntR family transcriptional regulator n=1 Tax=Rathayibacter soli TaxID=3144168 RepID=UPI0027E47CEF|nr:GntR family transcriptional regulator [Glaciibacter superstes]
MTFNALQGPTHRLDLAPTNTIADQVVEEILRAIDAGEYAPGDIVNDVEMAARFGVSRTPVREALQRLRVFRVIETAASRYTRITRPDRGVLIEGRIVWVALLGAVIDEVAENAPTALIDELEQSLMALREAIDNSDGNGAIAGVQTYLRSLMRYSHNRTLLEALSAYLHQFGLAVRSIGGTHAAELIAVLFAVDGRHSLLQELADALRAGDVAACRDVLRSIQRQGVPTEESLLGLA